MLYLSPEFQPEKPINYVIVTAFYLTRQSFTCKATKMSSESESGSSPPPPPKKSKSSSSSKKRKNNLDEIEVDLTLPEPPSKKAKRALKKGKPLPTKKDSDDDDDDNYNDDDKAGDAAGGEKNAATGKKEKERSPYGVWIGNLRFTVTKDDLRQWLIDNSGGALSKDAITRVHLPASKQNKGLAEFENRGFAYVDFATYEATVAAIALSETEWHRRKLLIKDAKSYEGRPEEHLHNKKKLDADGNKKDGEEEAAVQPQSTSRKVFVGNMSFQTTEDDVRELFSKCGEIEWVKVATFEDSGKCKGYGWVKFKEAAAADWAAKGFVKIKEVEETEEDFMDVDEKDEEKKEKEEDDKGDGEEKDDDEEEEATTSDEKKKRPAAAPKKKVKMRKWWVNQLNGRRLKIEHAEDDQTRYKKRFGKNKEQQENGGSRQDQQRSRYNNNNNDRRGNKGSGGDHSQSTSAEVSTYRSDINVARLTGAAVKPEGKKITFD